MVIIDDIGKMAFVCKRIEDIWWKNYWLDEQTSTHPTQITVWKTSLTSFKSEMDGWTQFILNKPKLKLSNISTNHQVCTIVLDLTHCLSIFNAIRHNKFRSSLTSCLTRYLYISVDTNTTQPFSGTFQSWLEWTT